MTDQEIIQRYRRDEDQRWVGKLYERYAHLVLGLCCKYLGDQAAAEDATCEIFISLMDKLKQHEVAQFRGWLYTTARNHCLMKLRAQKKGRHTALNGQALEAEEEGLSLLQLREERLDLLEATLAQLGQEQRSCLEHFYLQEMSYQQVAERTGYSLKAVKSHIQNGKRNLKKLLAQHEAFDDTV